MLSLKSSLSTLCRVSGYTQIDTVQQYLPNKTKDKRYPVNNMNHTRRCVRAVCGWYVISVYLHDAGAIVFTLWALALSGDVTSNFMIAATVYMCQ